RQLDDLVTHLIGDAVPDPLRPGFAIFQRIDAAGKEAVIPAIEGRARYAEFLQCAPRRQVRVLDQPDDLQLLGCGVSHSSSPPSAIMLMEWLAPLPWRMIALLMRIARRRSQ